MIAVGLVFTPSNISTSYLMPKKLKSSFRALLAPRQQRNNVISFSINFIYFISFFKGQKQYLTFTFQVGKLISNKNCFKYFSFSLVYLHSKIT